MDTLNLKHISFPTADIVGNTLIPNGYHMLAELIQRNVTTCLWNEQFPFAIGYTSELCLIMMNRTMKCDTPDRELYIIK